MSPLGQRAGFAGESISTERDSENCQRTSGLHTRRAGKRHLRIRARSASGQVAGAAITNTGSQPIEQDRPARPRLLPDAPVPDGRTVLTNPDVQDIEAVGGVTGSIR